MVVLYQRKKKLLEKPFVLLCYIKYCLSDILLFDANISFISFDATYLFLIGYEKLPIMITTHETKQKQRVRENSFSKVNVNTNYFASC